MPGLFKSSLCYKYTYPFGMLNSLISSSGVYDFCSVDKDKSGKCEDVSDCDDLNQSIARILEQHFTDIDISNIANQNINYSTSLPTKPDGSMDNIRIAQLSVDPNPPDYIKNFMKIEGKKGIGYPSPSAEFGCSANINQTIKMLSSEATDIDEGTSTKILNKINSKIDEHQSMTGFSDTGIFSSFRNQLKNHGLLESHIREKTNSIIRQSQTARQNITYIDNYRKCGRDKDGKPVGANVVQNIDFQSVAKNVIKTTIDQMMKNDENLRISSQISISKTSDRVVFFSFLLNILFIYLTFKLFTSDSKLYIKLIIYFGILIFVFAMLYISKN